jgi:hypothetical protein
VPRRLFFAAPQRIAITSSPNKYQKMRCFITRKNQEETAEETFEWGRRGDRRPLEDLPDLFYDFCWERAKELRAQIKSTEGMEEEPRVTALPSGYRRIFGNILARAMRAGGDLRRPPHAGGVPNV